ncbi:MAG TPA: hypothetical protein VHN16_01945 [Streptosporangiaceae bacterium]|nr:hypothetical protein [Streptosporangiaceae bacterium]
MSEINMTGEMHGMSRKKKILIISIPFAFVVLVVIGVIIGTRGSGPSVSACKAAMKSDYSKSLADPSGPAQTEPAPCKGLSAATVSNLATQIMEGK